MAHSSNGLTETYPPRSTEVPPKKKDLFESVTIKHIFIGLGVCLGVGTLIYKYSANLGWTDAFYNASMILSSMGPVDHPPSAGGKVVASFYAIFCGAFLLAIIAYGVDKLLVKYSS